MCFIGEEGAFCHFAGQAALFLRKRAGSLAASFLAAG